MIRFALEQHLPRKTDYSRRATWKIHAAAVSAASRRGEAAALRRAGQPMETAVLRRCLSILG